METAEKKALLEASLMRAAEQLGDITAPVFAHYYARCPQAPAMFRHHDPHGRDQLEGTMVEQALYCLMHWFDSPGEIEIILITTIPHHIETLGISGELFSGLLESVCDTITATIPPGEDSERAVWRELSDTLLGICTESASHAKPRAVAA